MSQLREIVSLITKAQEIGSKIGYHNLLQPGLVKELIIGEILGHEVHKTKHDADAWSKEDPTKLYEYLTCYEGGSFQFDRMFKAPPEKREKSISRIGRCHKIYCVVLFKEKPLRVRAIFELEPDIAIAEIERQLDKSSNDISHTSFSISWTQSNATEIQFNQEF